jgi:hypothetical protein
MRAFRVSRHTAFGLGWLGWVDGWETREMIAAKMDISQRRGGVGGFACFVSYFRQFTGPRQSFLVGWILNIEPFLQSPVLGWWCSKASPSTADSRYGGISDAHSRPSAPSGTLLLPHQ